MEYKVIIPGELPGMNEIIDAAKNPYKKYMEYSSMKRIYTETCAWAAKATRISMIEKPVDIVITWYSKDERRDIDNVMAGQKFILDGLVAGGVLKNDTRKYVKSIKHIPEIDRKDPRAEVVLIEKS